MLWQRWQTLSTAWMGLLRHAGQVIPARRIGLLLVSQGAVDTIYSETNRSDSDGSHCWPGTKCGDCTDKPGICCYGPGDYTDASFSTNLASFTKPPAETSYTSYAAATATSYTDATTYDSASYGSSAASSYSYPTSSSEALTSTYTTTNLYTTTDYSTYESYQYYSTYFQYFFPSYYYSGVARGTTVVTETISRTTTISAFCTATSDASYSLSTMSVSVISYVLASAARESARVTPIPEQTTTASNGSAGATSAAAPRSSGTLMLMVVSLAIGSLALAVLL